MIEVDFKDFVCNVKIVDELGAQHVLNLSKLHEKIEPEKSTWRYS